MAELLLDGECHNGQNAERLGDDHWRIEARGDNAHYCYYFHFTLRAVEAEMAVVDVAPDRTLPDALRSFRSHRPEAVWRTLGGGWARHPVATDAPPDCIRVRLSLNAAEIVSISRMRPYPYSAVVVRLAELAAHPEARSFSLGSSAQGREIAALSVGSGADQVMVLAGQHPAEFGGSHAVMGIAEWLLSRTSEARALRSRFTMTVIPVVNPDGNVGGHTGCNVRGEDLYRAFGDAAKGVLPEAPEAACVWKWIREHQPVLTLNFHTYTQAAPTGDFPWEGLYTAPDAAFDGSAARARQRGLDDALAWETDGLSQSGRFAHHVPEALEYQLASIGIPTVFYEVQDVVGPFRQRRTGVHVLRSSLKALALFP
jgi:hypothetical protein